MSSSAGDMSKWLDANTRVRLGVSLSHGVGVFALCEMSAGDDPFPGIKKRHRLVPMTREQVDELRPHVRDMVLDFCIPQDGVFWVYRDGFASMDASFYMNASEDPNVEVVHGTGNTLCCFRMKRQVQAGEELTFHYTTDRIPPA